MKPRAVIDLEIYSNYFLVMFKSMTDGKTKAFEFYDGHSLDKESIETNMKRFCTIGFNSIKFDLPILYLAMSGASNRRLKEAVDNIINKGMPPWVIEDKYKFKVPKTIDHIDLIDIAPGKASLKAYGGRIHAPKLQDLPIGPAASIEPEQRELLRAYCANDLNLTHQLHDILLPQIKLREIMSKEYEQDLRSKSDAQIAEAVIKKEVYKISKKMPQRPAIDAGIEYKYKAPGFIKFKTKNLRNILTTIESSTFIVSEGGKIMLPEELKNFIIKIGKGEYKIGIGGLHSCEKSVSHVAAEGEHIIDRDVTSYYPAIILNCKLFPENVGEDFLTVYSSIVNRRIEAKKKGDKVTADTLKICANGTFGKLGSKWSALYAPDLMIMTTITGQLSLLMLIELLESRKIEVISANTDGVVFKTRDQELVNNIIESWEGITGFNTEETRYQALYSKDVNNYIAIKTDNGAKVKGQYVPPNFMKNPANEIVSEAVVKFLSFGKNIEDTIRGCLDIRKFITLRSVKGGAVFKNEYLGKTVRWYYSTTSKDAIHYKVNGYLVARSEGCTPVMELPESLPDDINYEWYIIEAQSVLADIGWKENENAEKQSI